MEEVNLLKKLLIFLLKLKKNNFRGYGK